MKQVRLRGFANPQNKYDAFPPDWVRRLWGLPDGINSILEETQSHSKVSEWPTRQSPSAPMKQVRLRDFAKPQNQYDAFPPDWVRRLRGLPEGINSILEETQSHSKVSE